MIPMLAWFHRWLGIASCLLFALWFASGIVLLFVPFPALPAAQRLAMAAPINLTSLSLTPTAALAALGPGASDLRIRDRAGRTVYLAATPGGEAAVDGVSGQRLSLLDRRDAAGIVSRAVRLPATAVGPFDYDQWIVHNQFDPLRPFFRVDVEDSASTAFYVSARTGEIVQRTTAWQRGWNWVGAVLHWAYFTPLRSSFHAWDRTIWTVSFIAMLVALAGAVLGIIRTLAVRRARGSGLTFYRLRWMRWHHLAGLATGLFVVTWILSGWLSMDHGRLFSRGNAEDRQAHAFAGLSSEQIAEEIPVDVLRRLPPSHEVGLIALAGHPFLKVTGNGGVSRLRARDGSPLTDRQVDLALRKALANGWSRRVAFPPVAVADDDFYGLAEGMPPGVWRYAGENGRPPIYIDPGSGRIVTVMTASRVGYAWVYYGLHSFNFPGLASHQWLRRILMLLLLVPGLAFSLTGVVLGWRRLRKSVAPHVRKENVA